MSEALDRGRIPATVPHEAREMWECSVCDIYWGSHGCHLGFGHDGPHVCSCCDDPAGHATDPDHWPDCVGAPPYYGPETRFYGDDVPPGWLRVT